MITIIFIAEDGEPVSIRFVKNDDLNVSHQYGKWNVDYNEIQLNERGWELFQSYRNDIRKLKPLLAQLQKFGDTDKNRLV